MNIFEIIFGSKESESLENQLIQQELRNNLNQDIYSLSSFIDELSLDDYDFNLLCCYISNLSHTMSALNESKKVIDKHRSFCFNDNILSIVGND